MSDIDVESIRAAGAAIGEAISVFMLNPDTFEKSLAAGYPDPFAAYFAGRGGVLGDVTGTTLNAVFAVFEPNLARSCWENGTAVHDASESCRLYWEQIANFGRTYLTGAEGLDRIAALGEKVIAQAPEPGLPLYAGWRAMPLAEDAPARALQVMMVLRELRAAVHFNALTISGLSPVEAHILNHGTDYAAFMGWQPPFVDAAGKEGLYDDVEEVTDRRMAQIFQSSLTAAEADDLARLSVAALASLKASAPAPVGA